MKIIRYASAIAAGLLLLAGCKPENTPSGEKDKPVSLSPSFSFTSAPSADVAKDGGNVTISFKANMPWTASVNSDWLTLSASSGPSSESSQSVSVTVAKNSGDVRDGSVLFKMGTLSAEFKVQQETAKKNDGIETVNIKQFKAMPVSSSVWYRMTATIASVANYDYGNLYVVDETGGFLYVYGLTAEKSETNDMSFSKLKLKPGDEVTFVTHRSKYNDVDEAGGTVPAYYEEHVSGVYNGSKSSSTSAKWMELPSTSDDDGKDVLVHNYFTSEFSGRSYTMYWDYDNFVATWAAYPLTMNNMGSGSRSDAWALDPLLKQDEQPNISKNSFKVGNGGQFIRGHQVPSADRLTRHENLEVFFGTNITPQNSALNEGVWEDLEMNVREWARKCDTLYVVTGCDVQGSTTYCLDNDDKKITVPVGYYKALLRYSKTEGYIALGAYFDNVTPDKSTTVKSGVMSIDELEKKLGIDFFVNLDKATADKVEAENPLDQNWWWK